jgi:hypothetical protein
LEQELTFGTDGVISKINAALTHAFGPDPKLARAWLRAQLARLKVQSLDDLSFRQLLDLKDLVDEAAKGASERTAP